jgi:hypothetical protein
MPARTERAPGAAHEGDDSEPVPLSSPASAEPARPHEPRGYRVLAGGAGH